MKLENREMVRAYRTQAKETMAMQAVRILICAGTGCLADQQLFTKNYVLCQKTSQRWMSNLVQRLHMETWE